MSDAILEPAGHVPVLVDEVVRLLRVQPGDTVLDATVGLGGHALRLAEALGPAGRLIGLDCDPEALSKAREALSSLRCRWEVHKANFADAREVMREVGCPRADVIFADLGVNSTQIEDVHRGLSFQQDAPLDMRLDPELKTTAADLVNRLGEKELGDLLFHNTQEPASRKIARRIFETRKRGRIVTTLQLSRVVCESLGVMDQTSRRSRIHPATRTFLALRMAVNHEMQALDRLLELAPELLNPGGRVALISFHSTEDRKIKRDFLRRRSEGIYQIVTRKPVVSGDEERRRNPRSRSAKLRVATRLGIATVSNGPVPVGDVDPPDGERPGLSWLE